MLLTFTCSNTHKRVAYPIHRVESIKDNEDGRARVYLSEMRGESIITVESFDELVSSHSTKQHTSEPPFIALDGKLTKAELKELIMLQAKAMNKELQKE